VCWVKRHLRFDVDPCLCHSWPEPSLSERLKSRLTLPGVHVVVVVAFPPRQVRKPSGWLTTQPTGGLAHLAWWEGNDNHNMDAWESEAAFQAFGETRLGPAMAKAGVNVEPKVTFHRAHEVYLPEALTIT
jgi:hypothetical protein